MDFGSFQALGKTRNVNIPKTKIFCCSGTNESHSDQDSHLIQMKMLRNEPSKKSPQIGFHPTQTNMFFRGHHNGEVETSWAKKVSNFSNFLRLQKFMHPACCLRLCTEAVSLNFVENGKRLNLTRKFNKRFAQ